MIATRNPGVQYPHAIERLARVFAIHAVTFRHSNSATERKLAARYTRASLYLYGRIGRSRGMVHNTARDLANDAAYRW